MHKNTIGFTLAELLIALLILGVIATFTIPKVLQRQQNSRDNAVAKEAAGMISGAYQAYKQNNTPTAAFNGSMLTPYMNYVSIDSTNTIDHFPNIPFPTVNCAGGVYLCLRMHNGSTTYMSTGNTFGGTGNLNMVQLCSEPDGRLTGASGDTGKAVCFALYYHGKLTTLGQIEPGSTCAGGLCPPALDPSFDPDWFSWN